MIRTSAFVTAAIIGAVVFTGTVPAQGADQNAVKRAIVVAVLNNLGVQPTDQLVSEIVTDIPIELLDSALVLEVGVALDNSIDPTLIIGQAVDSDGDGVPNADAVVDSSDETGNENADETADENADENAGETSKDSSPSTEPQPKPKPDDDDESNGESDNESGDHDDN